MLRSTWIARRPPRFPSVAAVPVTQRNAGAHHRGPVTTERGRVAREAPGHPDPTADCRRHTPLHPPILEHARTTAQDCGSDVLATAGAGEVFEQLMRLRVGRYVIPHR